MASAERPVLEWPARRRQPPMAGLLLVFLLALSRAAFAEPAPAPASGATAPPAAKAEAGDRFDRGVRLFEKGDLAGALAEFKRANELVPNPLVLYNMGLVYAAMNRPVESARALDAYLAQAPARQREQRRRAESVRSDQMARIGLLLVRTGVPATIEVDGVEVGQTPLAEPLRVASGAHIVGALAPGYLPLRKEVTLAGQVTATVDFVLLPAQSRMAQLVVTSVPAGAEVVLNGQPVGVTPLPASVAIAPGTAQVEVRRHGYLPAVKTLTLGDGARGELAFALQEDPRAPAASKATLRLSVSEPEVEVMVDGVARNLAGGGLLLPPGPHEVRVVRAGFEPYERAINLAAGGETPLAVVLVPTHETRERYESSVRLRRTVGWATLGTGVVLAVAGAVYGISMVGDVSDARKDLDGVIANERDPGNRCWASGAEYDAYRCGDIKAAAQDQVDRAELRRNLGFVGAGVGVLAAGVGTYLLLASGDPNRYRKGGVAWTGAAFWADGGRAGLSLGGRF